MTHSMTRFMKSAKAVRKAQGKEAARKHEEQARADRKAAVAQLVERMVQAARR